MAAGAMCVCVRLVHSMAVSPARTAKEGGIRHVGCTFHRYSTQCGVVEHVQVMVRWHVMFLLIQALAQYGKKEND